ncbi:MAG TPA: HAMP domain-containing sensor histidine kinase, partial [bacterium]|nr:HAMP domain-containing sensor histidine kinase [bacterium]
MAAPQPPTVAQLQPVLDEVERAGRIIRPLLQFARDTGDRPAPTPVELHALVSELVTLHRPAMAQRQLTLTAALPATTVLARPDALRQVLTNLLLNAADATPAGGSISLVSAAADGKIGCSICDTGCGMPPEVLEQAGEPFFTTKPAGQGTGLGLTITRHLLHELGGTLSLASHAGRGTIATVLLPPVPEHAHA